MTRRAAAVGLFALAATFPVGVTWDLVSLRSDLAAAKRDAWEAHIAAASARSEAQRMTAAAAELGARLDDVERLALELQDGVPPEAYRNGFPGAEDEWQRRSKRVVRVADAGSRR